MSDNTLTSLRAGAAVTAARVNVARGEQWGIVLGTIAPSTALHLLGAGPGSVQVRAAPVQNMGQCLPFPGPQSPSPWGVSWDSLTWELQDAERGAEGCGRPQRQGCRWALGPVSSPRAGTLARPP